MSSESFDRVAVNRHSFAPTNIIDRLLQFVQRNFKSTAEICGEVRKNYLESPTRYEVINRDLFH